ncbi:MAG: hypothetical protein OXF30_01830 [Candidatus Saccharibacteria bacterium]|nr:hypothetical protein [Candidatus Saccharibacteria bacterium]
MLVIDKLGVKKQKLVFKCGRVSKLTDLDVLTILIYNGLVERYQTLRNVYLFIVRD